jgi:hypothetical protein
MQASFKPCTPTGKSFKIKLILAYAQRIFDYMISFLKYSLILFFCLSFTELDAQIRSGQTIGVNLSNMSVNASGNEVDAENSTGINFGGLFDIPVIGHLTFRPAVLFSGKGSMYQIDTADVSISPVYLEVPAMAVYTFGWHSVKLSLFAGPYIAFGFGGNKIENGGNSNNINYGSGESDDIRHFDAGVNIGAGISFRNLMISAQYGYGMTDLLPGSLADSEMKNRVIGISITSFVTDREKQ